MGSGLPIKSHGGDVRVEGKAARWPVSRVLSKALLPLDDHSSSTAITDCVEQPTRIATRKPVRWQRRGAPSGHPYSVLLPVGFTMPTALLKSRCALTAPFHPDPHEAGGLFSVALSLGLPPPGVTRHRVSVEPGLSSGPATRPIMRSSSHLAVAHHSDVFRQRRSRKAQHRHGSGRWFPGRQCHSTAQAGTGAETR